MSRLSRIVVMFDKGNQDWFVCNSKTCVVTLFHKTSEHTQPEKFSFLKQKF